MRTLRGAALLLSAVALLAPGAHADDASRRAKAEEVFRLTHMQQSVEQAMDGMMKQMSSMMRSQLASSQATPEQQKSFEEFLARVQSLITKSAGWSVMEPKYAELYASTYSEEELDGLIAFYKSPVGQAYVSKSPELTQKSLALSQKEIIAIMPQVQQMAAEYAKQAQGVPPMAPPPASAPKQ